MRTAVVMPAHNAARWIDRALASIERQSRPVDCVCVVDDGSTDDTADRIRAWSSRLPIRLLQNDRNFGIGESLRRGVATTDADWVFRLDADDAWLPEHLWGLIASIELHPASVLASSGARLVNAEGAFLGSQVPPCDEVVRQRLMWDNPLIHSATGFSRRAYESVGGYRSDTRWEDYDLWIRLLRIGELAQVQTLTMAYTLSPNSLSRVRRADSIRSRWECQRRAIYAFGTRYPGAALRCLALGGFRVTVARWR